MSRQGKISDTKTHLSMILPKEVKAELVLLAKLEGRSLSNFLVVHLARLVEKKRSSLRDGASVK
jgi:hypothetical protein